MNKDDLVYVGHMLDTARKAELFITQKDRSDFDADEPLQIALAHLLQTIGEAARRISSEFQESHPEIPWKPIVGMRHKVVHDYMSVDEEVVWKTVISDLPSLITALEEIVQVEDDSGEKTHE